MHSVIRKSIFQYVIVLYSIEKPCYVSHTG